MVEPSLVKSAAKDGRPFDFRVHGRTQKKTSEPGGVLHDAPLKRRQPVEQAHAQGASGNQRRRLPGIDAGQCVEAARVQRMALRRRRA